MTAPANLRGWGQGWPVNRSADMEWVQTARSGVRFQVHGLIAPIVKYLIDEVERRGYMIHTPGQTPDDWSYNNRPIRGSNPPRPSNHSWGLAIDIDATQFPLGSRKRLPSWIVELFKSHGFDYGGDWRRPDPMHFEFNGWPSDARRIAGAVGHVTPPSQRPVTPVPITPPVTPAELLAIQQLLQEDDDMIVIRNGKGIAHLVNNRTVLLNGPKALERVRAAYKKANRPLPELTLESDGEWTNYTGLR